MTTSRDDVVRRFVNHPAMYLLIGVAAAVVGLLPWLTTGARLPLQNLWASDTTADEMPITLLPFSQYALTLIAAVIITGPAIAGAVLRWRRALLPRFALTATAGGVLLVQIIALVQTAIVVSSGLRASSASDFYLLAVITGTVAAIAIGLALLVVIARSIPQAATIAISVAAIAIGIWIQAVIAAFGTVTLTGFASALLSVTRWIPAVIVGLAVAWCGFSTVSRAAASVVSFGVLALVTAGLTAISVAAGTRVLASNPADMAQYAWKVFYNLTGVSGWSAQLVAVALMAAIAGIIVRWMSRRRAARQL